jgi:hypothetical protein
MSTAVSKSQSLRSEFGGHHTQFRAIPGQFRGHHTQFEFRGIPAEFRGHHTQFLTEFRGHHTQFLTEWWELSLVCPELDTEYAPSLDPRTVADSVKRFPYPTHEKTKN